MGDAHILLFNRKAAVVRRCGRPRRSIGIGRWIRRYRSHGRSGLQPWYCSSRYTCSGSELAIRDGAACDPRLIAKSPPYPGSCSRAFVRRIRCPVSLFVARLAVELATRGRDSARPPNWAPSRVAASFTGRRGCGRDSVVSHFPAPSRARTATIWDR